MSEAKFTKEKWEVVDGHYPSFIEIQCGNTMDISICWNSTDLSYSDGIERKANAYLMAAAPEMYAMLKSLDGLLGFLDRQTHPNIELDCQQYEIRNLLAKARGEV